MMLAMLCCFPLGHHSAVAFAPPTSNYRQHHRMIHRLTRRTFINCSIAIKATPRFSSSLQNNNDTYSSTISHGAANTHGGIPIGAVQLGSKHIQKFSNLINETLTKTSKKSLSYRGVQPFIGPRNIIDKEEGDGGDILLVHVPPIVATALDDDHPDLVNFLTQTNGVYLPGVRRSRMHRSATRRKRNANIKEEQSAAAQSKSTITAETTSSEPTFTFSELFAGIGGFRLGLEAM